MQAEFRKLPSVELLLQDVMTLAEAPSRKLTVEAIREELALARETVRGGKPAPSSEQLLSNVLQRLDQWIAPTLRPVINATGVIVHTNLGRALLSQRAQQNIIDVANSYSNLEYSLEAGKRGSRYTHTTELLCLLTGAEDAVVVNNNASAVILCLIAFAQGKQVIISRSQLVEIGGGFRVPDIMVQSGAELVEVGTTNKTYIRDYEYKIDPARTGLLLAVHYSNYQIVGFTHQPSLVELAELGQKHGVPVMEDLGSGTLLDTAPFGLTHEPTIQESLAAGLDLVTASGDKLLGGPQAGLILGKRAFIQRLKEHPLIRALRVDKTTLAALQATLLAYLEGTATREIPVWQMISASPDSLAGRASRWRDALQSTGATVCTVQTESTVGGGSLPGQTLPSTALAITVDSPDRIVARLRHTSVPIIARIDHDQLLFDPRTVLPAQDERLIETLRELF